MAVHSIKSVQKIPALLKEVVGFFPDACQSFKKVEGMPGKWDGQLPLVKIT